VARSLSKAFKSHIESHRVSVTNGYFEEAHGYDAIVSPANSFGLMDGGFDAALTKFFGGYLQSAVQERIIKEYSGEQPVRT
jgi:O-acetyl-ADP-ribose deacetylase (regulator of RNase III)